MYWKSISYFLNFSVLWKNVVSRNEKLTHLSCLFNSNLQTGRWFYFSVSRNIIIFKQSYWFKKCIDFNRDKKNAVNCFEIVFFELMINSVYGKNLANFRKVIKIRLVNNAKRLYKICKKTRFFVSQKIFNRKFLAFHEIKPVLILDKKKSM